MNGSILLDGQVVPYRIRLSARSRRVGLRFTDEGLEVVRPARLRGAFSPEPMLRRFSSWIRRQLARQATVRAQSRAAEGRILLRGRELLLDVRPLDWIPGVGIVRTEGDRLVIESGDGERREALLRNWFFDEARRGFNVALRRRSAEMNQPFARLAVRDQQSLWGSCSRRSGTVSLNVRLIMAPPEVLDYIVVHELAHFRWRGHGARFWDRVSRFCPDHKRHRRWLKENSWRLSLSLKGESL